MKTLLFALLIIVVCSCSEQKKEQTFVEKYKLYKPEDLIIDAFKNKDVIFIGEAHWIKEEVDFIKSIIPILNKNDINILFSEFVSYDDTKLIDSLLTADKFDEKLARSITSRSLFEWSYQEYIDILHVAWEVNQKSEKQFRIIGLLKDYNCSAIQKPEDFNDPEKRKAFFGDGESDWANRIIDETYKKNKKALVYCGAHHSITHYVQPLVEDGKFIGKANKNDRVGQCVYNKYPETTITIWIHHSWAGKKGLDDKLVIPMHSYFDKLVDSLPSDFKSYAFFTNESILGEIVDSSSYYSLGYDSFTLKDLCHGYIFLKPVCNQNLAGYIENFIDTNSIKHAQEQVRVWLDIKDISIEAINDTLKNWYNQKLEAFNKGKRGLCHLED